MHDFVNKLHDFNNIASGLDNTIEDSRYTRWDFDNVVQDV